MWSEKEGVFGMSERRYQFLPKLLDPVGESRSDFDILLELAARLEKACDPDGILMAYETYVHVRDLVDAEERPPLTAKGIRREIRPFAAKGIFEAAPSRFIRRERDGMSLYLDFEKIGPVERRAVRDDLEAALRRLGEELEDGG